jgi:hypothetical protein
MRPSARRLDQSENQTQGCARHDASGGQGPRFALPFQISRVTSRRGTEGWKTFLRNHAAGIASMDLFVVPTVSFRLLYGFLILQHSRRKLLWLGVTARPNAHWIARQLTEAYGWQQAPRYIVRDPAVSSNGYTGSTDFTAVAMAKRVFGEAHRFDPTGLS